MYAIEKQIHVQCSTDDVIRSIRDRTPPDELSKIEQLWRTISLEDPISNPAICASRFLDDGQHTESGQFSTVYALTNGEDVLEHDLLKWTVAGRGTLRHPEQYASMVISCEDDLEHYAKTVPRHCGKLTCPACASYEISYNAPKQAVKLLSGAKYARRARNEDGILQHLTISPPEEFYPKFLTIEGFAEMKRYAAAIASEVGIKGGMMVFHPFRQNGINEDDDLPEQYAPAQSNNLDKHCARFAPHFHVLGYGWIAPSSKAFVDSHKGWMYKAVRTGNKRIKTAPEVVGVIKYLMSHVGIIAEDSPAQPPRMQTITWLGSCNSHVLSKVGEVAINEGQICPDCGRPLAVHAVHGRQNDITYLGQLYNVRRYAIYADSAHRDGLRTFIEANRIDHLGILQYLEKNPEMGVCLLSSRDLDRALSRPEVVKCNDGTMHVLDVYSTMKLCKKRTKKPPTTPPGDSDPEEVRGNSGRVEHLDLDGFIIDYHLPPEVGIQ